MDTGFLRKSRLFKGMTEEEILSALSSFHAQEKTYKKGQALLHAGDITEELGLVLEGSVTIESNDAWGNRTILSHVGSGQLFAETYALLDDEPLLVDVIANEDCRILFLRVGNTHELTAAAAPWASRFAENVLTISALKNLHLSGRSFHTAPKTVRGRVMAYLNTVSLQTQSREFDIPLSEITEDTNLKDLDMDSVSFVVIMMNIEDKMNVRLNVDSSSAFQTVGDVLNAIKSAKNQ